MRDAVYLALPAYPLRDADELARARERGQRFAARLGLPLTMSPLSERLRPNGAVVDAATRSEDLLRGLEHRVLLAARGGYGCVDLIATLARHAPAAGVPLLVGFSDVTVLHAWWRRSGWPGGVYGFMPVAAGGEAALDSGARAALGEGVRLDRRSQPQARVIAGGEARGETFAACLRVLAGLVGTPAMPDLAGTILALEDIDERPYQVERDLTQLALAGALRGVRALVFAGFPCRLPADYAGPSALDVATRCARALGVPAIFGLGFGHHPDPIAIACGRGAVLRCAADDWELAIAPAAAPPTFGSVAR